MHGPFVDPQLETTTATTDLVIPRTKARDRLARRNNIRRQRQIHARSARLLTRTDRVVVMVEDPLRVEVINDRERTIEAVTAEAMGVAADAATCVMKDRVAMTVLVMAEVALEMDGRGVVKTWGKEWAWAWA